MNEYRKGNDMKKTTEENTKRIQVTLVSDPVLIDTEAVLPKDVPFAMEQLLLQYEKSIFTIVDEIEETEEYVKELIEKYNL